jgi:hypothetical protein
LFAVGIFDTVPAMEVRNSTCIFVTSPAASSVEHAMLQESDLRWYDTSLGSHISAGYHALALDEARKVEITSATVALLLLLRVCDFM